MGDLDAEGNEQYNIGNPGLGRSEINPGVGADGDVPDAGSRSRQYDALQLRLGEAHLRQLVRQRQLHAQPALRKLRRSG